MINHSREAHCFPILFSPLTTVRPNNQAYAHKEQQREEHRIGMQAVETHSHREGHGKDGLYIGIGARHRGLEVAQRVVEQEIGQIGRHDKDKGRSGPELCVHIRKVTLDDRVDAYG